MKLRLLLTFALILWFASAIAQTQPTAIEFFPVSETPIPGGQFIDTPKFSRLGYIAPDPPLRATRLLRLSKGGSQTTLMGKDGKVAEFKILPTLILSFTEADAAVIAELTTQHVGKRILIKIGGVPVIAPYVNEPIKDGSIAITIKKEEEKGLEDMLKGFVRR